MQWNIKQWHYRFKCAWGFSPTTKHACLAWLILHHGVWTGKKASLIGKSNGICVQCKFQIEDVQHLFFYCEANK